MELKINQIILHLLDPGASEPLLSDRPMDLDADLFEYFSAGFRFCAGDGAEPGFRGPVPPYRGRDL